MKDYIRKRVFDICWHILESKHTVRQAAAVFGVSKSTVHTVRLMWNAARKKTAAAKVW